MGSFEEKLTRKIYKTQKNRKKEWEIFQGCFKYKKDNR